MGLLDFTSRVLTEYRADISDHKAKVRELSGEQKLLAEQELAAAKARNAALEDHMSTLTKVGLAIGAVAAAYEVAKKSFEQYAEYQKEAAASAKFDIDQLAEAAGGLKDDLELMTFAAKTSAGVFHLNQSQMETFQQAIRAYTKDGHDATEVTEAWTEALISGRTKGLKAIGVEIDETHSKTAKFNELIKAAQGEIRKYGGDLDVAGDDVRRAGVAWSDSLDHVKERIGALVVALAPLIELLSRAVGIIAALVPPNWQDAKAKGNVLLDAGAAAAGLETQAHRDLVAQYLASGVGGVGTALQARASEVNASSAETMVDTVSYLVTSTTADLVGRVRAARERHRSNVDRTLDDQAAAELRDWQAQQAERARLNGLSIGAAAPDALSAFGDQLSSGFGSLSGYSQFMGASDRLAASAYHTNYSRTGAQRGAAAGAAPQKWLEGVFGKLSEFDAYKNAIQGLTGALDAGYKAWASGSESAGAAFKKAIGSAIAGMGSNMFVHSLEQGALAIADLAVGNVAGAAIHGEAAAAFLAGSIAAGAISRQFGGDSAGAPRAGAGGGAPSVIGSGGGAQPKQNAPITIVLGDEFAQDTAYRRQSRAFSALQQAKKAGGDAGGVVWG